MMNEATLLESRLSKVEQDNRRLKLALGALLLALAAVPLIGAVMPEPVQDAVFARGFYVIDENRNQRASMNVDGIGYQDENDTTRAAMTDGGIGYHDENGTRRALMAEGILYSDQNGNVRLNMSAYGISYRDENGNLVWSTDCAPDC